MLESYYHMIAIFANLYLCGKIRSRLSKSVLKRENLTVKQYLQFLMTFVFLIGINMAAFMIMHDRNLFEQIECPRSFSLMEVKQYGDDLKVQIMSIQNMTMPEKVTHVKKAEEIISVLSHPARRLTYDSFGLAQVEYAWAFKSPSFLISMVAQSAFFYIICTFMSLISERKAIIKEALKTEIVVMVLLFVWEIDIIMNTERRLHGGQSDIVDRVLFAFPYFERRRFLQLILIPSMNMVDIFVRLYVKSKPYQTIKTLATHEELKKITNPIAEKMPKVETNDKNFEEIMKKTISEQMSSNEAAAKIYHLQRQIITMIFLIEKENILPDPLMERIVSYYRLPFNFTRH